MIKRTLYFGHDAYLHFKNQQLVIDFPDEEKKTVLVPVEDIGVIVLDSFRLTITQHLITKLLQNNVALITCDEKRMPIGLMLNLDGHHMQQELFANQLNASVPLKKQLWQQTIKAKIFNQYSLLKSIIEFDEPNSNDFENMLFWSKSVRSGDPDNYEARAAAFYWGVIFSSSINEFKRGREEPFPNPLLNYGYAILRAVTARSLVASGMLPTFGVHHHNKYNAYALADDIMEPYRPFVDRIVRELVISKYSNFDKEEDWTLNTEIKKELLQIPAVDVMIDGEKSPLMIAMQRTTASLQHCFAGVSKEILYPLI